MKSQYEPLIITPINILQLLFQILAKYQLNMCSPLRAILQTLILIAFVEITQAYIDIDCEITSSSSDIAFNLPLTIGNGKYPIALSLENKQQIIVQPQGKHKSKAGKGGNKAELIVSSLQGYTLEGWKRFFMEVFTFTDSRYRHKLQIDVSSIKKVEKYLPLTSGVMTLGPNLAQNKLYQLIKAQTPEYFVKDIVSFYTTPGAKELKVQFGGLEEQNARGFKNGYRFVQKNIEKSLDGAKWVLPVSKLVIGKQKGKKYDTFSIPFSNMKAKLSLESQFIILPQRMREDLETSFQTDSIQCSFSTTSSQLQCENISSVDQALTYLSFYLDEQTSLNISLYDLRDQYNPKSQVTSFFVKTGQVSQVQIGAPILRNNYVSINLGQSKLIFSPINRFSPQITTVSILRFLIFFGAFMVSACICVVVWQQFNNPQKRRRITRGKEGVRLVAYHRPTEFQDQI